MNSRHIGLHSVHIHPTEGQHSAESKSGNAEGNYRGKPAAEAGRVSLFVSFRTSFGADFETVLALGALVRKRRFTLCNACFYRGSVFLASAFDTRFLAFVL